MLKNVSDDDFPYFEDRLNETNTRRSDWVIGYRAMAIWLGTTPHKVRNLIAESDIPVEMVKPVNGSGNIKYTHSFIILKSKLEEWEKKRKEKEQLPLQLVMPSIPLKHNIDENLQQRLIKEQEETNTLLRSIHGDLLELITLWRGKSS